MPRNYAIIAASSEMDYREALNYVLDFSDYERWPGAGYAERWDLGRMQELLERLGSPHLQRKTVHIAGSKGKGSTAAMIASALGEAGFTTGLYTSPHLHTMRERIRVDGQLITEQEFASVVSELISHAEEVNRNWNGTLSTFELLTAVAFSHFHRKGTDFQVLETGLGGRLDATNVTIPEVCVLTSISLDHTAVLGDTIAQIAREKAGIIKPGVTVVSSPQASEAAEVIREVCSKESAKLIIVGGQVSWEASGSDIGGQNLRVKGTKGKYEIKIPLLGEHQLENAATAVAALEVLDIKVDSIIAGLSNLHWSGRLEVLRENPLLVVDGAHNGDSAARLVDSIKRYFECDRTILLMGSSADKNSSAMIAELAPFFSSVIVTTSQHPRATDAGELAIEFDRFGVKVEVAENVTQALSRALAQAEDPDLICATGSLFLVAEVIEHIRGIHGERYQNTETEGADESVK